MWELALKEGWALKNWCFWTAVLEKTLESPLDCKEIKPVHPKGKQSCIFIGRTDAEAETPILWPPDAKNWLIRKDLDAAQEWRQEEKGTTEDEMVGWHHWLDGQEFEQAPGAGNGHRSLACCSPWGRKESDKTEGLNWTELNWCRESMRRCIFCSSEVKWHLTSSSLFSLMMSFHWLDTGLFFFPSYPRAMLPTPPTPISINSHQPGFATVVRLLACLWYLEILSRESSLILSFWPLGRGYSTD